MKVTADFTSIDRFPQDTAPTVCLPFDGIGVQHPGIRRWPVRTEAGNLVSPLTFQSTRSSAAYGSCQGSPLFANDTAVGMSCTRDLAPVMPECRAPTPSKGK